MNRNYFYEYPDKTDVLNDTEVFILIFKTNIRSWSNLQKVSVILNDTSSILKWNIDRDDVDCVLRIESTQNNTNQIIKQINQSGLFCEELTY